MKRARLILLAFACVLGFAAQSARADTASVTPSLNATDVATCNGTTTVRLSLVAQDPPASLLPLDVVFVLDESGSITAANFATMRSSIAQFMSANVTPNGTHAGIIQFSGDARTTLRLTGNTASAVGAATAMFQRGGATAIGDGLQAATAEFNLDGRAGVPRIYILETDGFNNVNVAQLPTIIAGLHADSRNTVFAVGVGASTDPSELLSIASAPTDYYSAATYANLATIFTTIATVLNPAGSDLSYAMTAAPGWQFLSAFASFGSVTPNATGFTWSAPEIRTGLQTITYTLRHTGTTGGTLAPQSAAALNWTDDTGTPSSASFESQTVNVAGCNLPPHAAIVPVPDQLLSGSHTTNVALDGTPSTDDGQLAPLTYAWSDNGNPTGTGPTLVSAFGLGMHHVTLTVNDGQYTDTASVDFLVSDPTPPVVTPIVSGTLGTNGWYTSNIAIGWAVSDAESDLTSPPCAPGSVTADTAGVSFSCSATSAGGTTNASTGSLKRDATNPTVTFTGNTGTYGIADTVAITCTASDNLSGLASSTCPSASGPAYSFSAGTHTLTGTATDKAGNVGTASTTFTVVITAGDLCTLIDRFTDNSGVANSLCVKIQHGSIGAFVNEVNAQRGKHLDASEADLLISLAQAL